MSTLTKYDLELKWKEYNRNFTVTKWAIRIRFLGVCIDFLITLAVHEHLFASPCTRFVCKMSRGEEDFCIFSELLALPHSPALPQSPQGARDHKFYNFCFSYPMYAIYQIWRENIGPAVSKNVQVLMDEHYLLTDKQIIII